MVSYSSVQPGLLFLLQHLTKEEPFWSMPSLLRTVIGLLVMPGFLTDTSFGLARYQEFQSKGSKKQKNE
jgi:hypothetical protein